MDGNSPYRRIRQDTRFRHLSRSNRDHDVVRPDIDITSKTPTEYTDRLSILKDRIRRISPGAKIYFIAPWTLAKRSRPYEELSNSFSCIKSLQTILIVYTAVIVYRCQVLLKALTVSLVPTAYMKVLCDLYASPVNAVPNKIYKNRCR